VAAAATGATALTLAVGVTLAVQVPEQAVTERSSKKMVSAAVPPPIRWITIWPSELPAPVDV
jgi:hypothetical protein